MRLNNIIHLTGEHHFNITLAPLHTEHYRALGVLNDYALYKSKLSLTHSLIAERREFLRSRRKTSGTIGLNENSRENDDNRGQRMQFS